MLRTNKIRIHYIKFQPNLNRLFHVSFGKANWVLLVTKRYCLHFSAVEVFLEVSSALFDYTDLFIASTLAKLELFG